MQTPLESVLLQPRFLIVMACCRVSTRMRARTIHDGFIDMFFGSINYILCKIICVDNK